MTYEEAINLKTFKNYCNCGGFACDLNGRDWKNPHTSNCPQKAEYEEWVKALNYKRHEFDFDLKKFVLRNKQ